MLNTEGKHSLCLHKWLTKAASHSLNKQLLQSQHMLTSPRFPARLLWPWYIPSRSRPTWPEAGLGSRGPVKETSLSYSSNLHLNISRPTFSSGMTCFSKGGVCGVITKVLIPFSYSVQISSHRQEKEEKNGSLCPLPSALLALCSLQHAYGHKINLRCELKLTSESDYIYQVISARVVL